MSEAGEPSTSKKRKRGRPPKKTKQTTESIQQNETASVEETTRKKVSDLQQNISGLGTTICMLRKGENL